jgi:outer membrane protein assembly factor BamB
VLVAGSEVMAFEARSGELSWRQRLRAEGTHLAVTEGIAAVRADDELVGVDVRTGAELWRTDVGWPGAAAMSSTRLAASGWTVAVLAGDGRVHAIDLRDGSVSWASPVVRGPELVAAVTDGERVFASTVEGATFVLDMATGASRADLLERGSASLLGARAGVAYYAGPEGIEAYQLEER